MILSSWWLVPALGAVATALSGARARATALGFALGTLALTCVPLWTGLDGLSGLGETGPHWSFGIRYQLGVGGLSMPLIWLNALLTVLVFAASWKREGGPGYWAAFLALESALTGVFLARDLFFFYIFWELVLIPMFFIIGLWGSEDRRHAAIKFFLFTFFGSLFLLFGILGLVVLHQRATGVWTWDMGMLRGPEGGPAALPIFLCLLVGFGVKVPIVPLHTWLPDAHTEAPAGGSVMLAGVMLKMGVYGLAALAIPAFPELSWKHLPWLGLLAVINAVWGALCAMAQSDLKRLVAYSSVAHLGFCLLGLFSRTAEGVTGGGLQLINHGLTTGALFLMVGFLYERTHKRGLADFGGLASRAPWLTFFFGVATFASIGLPGLNGFVGEFMSLAGMARVLPVLAIGGVIGVTLAAAYALPAFAAVFWAEPGPGSVSGELLDLDGREKAVLWTLTLLMLAIGLRPGPLLELLSKGFPGVLL